MSGFSIKPLPGERSQWGSELAEITIGNFSEKIWFTTEHWTIEQYEAHWRKEISDLVSEKKQKTMLYTSVQNPKTGKTIWGWALYKVGPQVFFRNFGYQLQQPKRGIVDLAQPEKLVPNRDGELTKSEWDIPISALQEWLEKLTD